MGVCPSRRKIELPSQRGQESSKTSDACEGLLDPPAPQKSNGGGSELPGRDDDDVHEKTGACFQEEKDRLLTWGLASQYGCTSWSDAEEDFGTAFSSARPEIRADREVALLAVSLDGALLRYCSEELRNDRDLVKEAVLNDISALEFAGEGLFGDRDLILTAVRCHGWALQFASDKLRGDREIVLTALKSLGHILRYATEELRSDRDIVLAAVERDPAALQWVPEALALDPELHSTALLRQVEMAPRLYSHYFCAQTRSAVRNKKELVLLALRWAPDRSQALACYGQASPEVKKAHCWKALYSAATSTIAAPGETAPLLTVALSELPSDDLSPGAKAIRCEVSLMSGASFVCHLDAPATGKEIKIPFLTVEDLAATLVTELPKHVEVCQPKRVFLLFSKDSGEAIPGTPWHWNRPITDFLRGS